MVIIKIPGESGMAHFGAQVWPTCQDGLWVRETDPAIVALLGRGYRTQPPARSCPAPPNPQPSPWPSSSSSNSALNVTTLATGIGPPLSSGSASERTPRQTSRQPLDPLASSGDTDYPQTGDD